MKNLKFKKIKIAKINNLSIILGGNNRQTIIVQGCMPDTFTCPPDFTKDPNYTSCQLTDLTLAGNVTGGFAETDQCDG